MQGMAAMSRRPRLVLTAAFAAALLAAGCSLLNPAPTVIDRQAQALHLAAGGKHADAARAYADLAALAPADRDNYELLSAEQWVHAGAAAAGTQAFDGGL